MRSIKKHCAIFMVFNLIFLATAFSYISVDSYAVGFPGKAKETAGKLKDDAYEKGQQAVEKGKDVAKKGKKTVGEKGKQVSNKVKGWYSNIDKEAFRRGWKHASDIASSEVAVNVSKKYIDSVSKSIEKFGADINASKGSARGVAQEAGFIAEKWHADTFNIDSAAGSSTSTATVPGSTKLGSPDIDTNFGQEVSLKYYNTASESANAQATTIIKKYNEYKASTDNPLSLKDYLNKNGYEKADQDLLEGIYSGQTRVIPSDQYDDAVNFLEGRIKDLSKQKGNTSTRLSSTYQETLESLSDRLKDPKGTQSRPATKAEMEAVAELAMKGDFKPEDFGFTLSQVITPKYIVKQAINSGEKTAAMNVALTLGPELYLVVAEAIETGQIDKADFEKMGVDAITSGSEGFVEGSVSSAILVACKAGKFGAKFKNANPDVVAALTVITIDSIRYGYALSKGEITPLQYSDLLAEEIVSSGGSLAAGAGLGLLFGGSQIAILAGCMAGGMLASVGYNIGKEAVLEMRDAGGFAAIVPKDTINGVLVDTDVVSSLKLNKAATLLDGMHISTSADGKIIIGS